MAPASSNANKLGTRKRVTKQHTLERVRNNQRRHRARRRGQLAALEEQLRNAEEHAAALQEQVDSLKMKLAQCCSSAPVPEHSEKGRLVCGQRSTSPDVPGTSVFQHQMAHSLPTSGIDTLLPGAVIPDHAPGLAGVCCLNGYPSQQEEGAMTVSVNGQNGTSTQLPEDMFQFSIQATYMSSSEGESMTPCAEAFVLISQQNFKGVTSNDVVAWLQGGFRKPPHPGGGCRVRTDLLFSLLAFISDT